MARIRPELVRGIAVLVIFTLVILSSDLLFPYPIQQSEYQVVSVDRLKQDPALFEGENISSQVRITSDLGNDTYVITEKGVDVLLVVPPSLGSLSVGELVYIRGTSWIQTNNSIAVHEFYVLDYNSSLIRSAPGIIIFVILFFSVFTIDIKQIAFVRRKRQSA